jgi:hypothetical protein
MNRTLFSVLSFTILFSSQSILLAQIPCNDPGGCSVVSLTAIQNNVEIIVFGNTTGKVFLKKKRTLCNLQDCNTSFAIATALVAPLPPASSETIQVPFDLNPNQVNIAVKFAVVNKRFAQSIGITLDRFLNDEEAKKLKTPENLNSTFPLYKGAGDNAIVGLAPAGPDQDKFVSQVLNPATNKLVSPVGIKLDVLPVLTAGSDRNLTLLLTVQKDLDDLVLSVIELNDNREILAPPQVITQPSAGNVIRSVTATPVLSNIPVLGRLFSAKAMKEDGHQLAVFITPVIIENQQIPKSPHTFQPGRPVAITNITNTPNPGAEFFQTVAIDPKGRFVLYAQYNPGCKKNILKLQRINPAAAFASNATPQSVKIGAPKILAGCGEFPTSTSGAIGLDVLNLE